MRSGALLTTITEWLFFISSFHSFVLKCPLSAGESSRSAHRKTRSCLGILQIWTYIFLKIKKQIGKFCNQSCTNHWNSLSDGAFRHTPKSFLLPFLVPVCLCKEKKKRAVSTNLPAWIWFLLEYFSNLIAFSCHFDWWNILLYLEGIFIKSRKTTCLFKNTFDS